MVVFAVRVLIGFFFVNTVVQVCRRGCVFIAAFSRYNNGKGCLRSDPIPHCALLTLERGEMDRAAKARKITYVLLVSILLLVVLAQIVDQVRKYLDGQTTVSKTSHRFSKLPFPSVSFCPGFRRGEVEKYPWMSWENFGYSSGVPESSTFPQDEEEVLVLWENITFGLSEVLVSADIFMKTPPAVTRFTADDISQGTAACLEIREFGTLSGKCYTLAASCAFGPSEGIMLYFNLSQVHRHEMDLVFHHPRASLGLNENFWPVPVAPQRIRGDEGMDILLRKFVKKQAEGRSTDDFFDCMDALIAKRLQENLPFCYFPSFESVFSYLDKNVTVTVCTDAENFTRSNVERVYKVFNGWFMTRECGAPRELERHWTLSKYISTYMLPRMAAVYVAHESTEVSVEEEYVLLDFPALLAAVGGFAGMILGWSVLDLIDSALLKSRNFAVRGSDKKIVT